MLCKYTGISFIAGSINHGAFSEQRSYLTAGTGVLCYLIGAFMDHKNNPDETNDWRGLFGFGVVLSIGIGFFTGGLQHFIDSPERSVWVVPIGFIMSAVALYFLEARKKISLKTFVIYACMSGVVVTGASVAARTYLNGGSASHHEHGKDHAH